MGRRKGTSAFPVARIKKMMQADEDIGKIATTTPVLVAKALECMMEDVVRGAAHVASSKGARTVTPQHLKICVESNDSFDFLRHVLKSVHVDNINENDKNVSSMDLNHTTHVRKRPRSPINGNEKPKRRGRGRPRSADKEKEQIDKMQIEQQNEQQVEAVTPPVPLPQIATNTTQNDDDDDEDYDEDDEDVQNSNDDTTNDQPSKKEIKTQNSNDISNNDDDTSKKSLPTNNTTKETDDTHGADRVSVHALLS